MVRRWSLSRSLNFALLVLRGVGGPICGLTDLHLCLYGSQLMLMVSAVGSEGLLLVSRVRLVVVNLTAFGTHCLIGAAGLPLPSVRS